MTNHAASRTARTDERIAALQQQLAQAQKLTALGELASTVTHEFNNVLMTIINYAKMGLRHKDEATRDKAFEKILAASERAATITNSVLGMARNRSDSFEPTDLAAIIKETLILVEREMRKYHVSVEMQIQQVPPANAIGNQVQQVLLNLLINARQATPEGGRVIIGLSHDASNDSVDLMVRDTGSGMPQEVIKQLFTPFFTTKQLGKGTGMGLAIVYGVVKMHSGDVTVESEVGKGTTFLIRLPLAEKAKEESA